MPSIPPVLIIGVNPIVEIVVPLLRAFGFQIVHLWSPCRLTLDIISLCKDMLNIEAFSCSLHSLDQFLNNATQPYIIFICTETDQHLSLIKRIISISTTRSLNSIQYYTICPIVLDGSEVLKLG